MAPFFDRDDDFVLTISDDEHNLPILKESKVVLSHDQRAPLANIGKKRKRGTNENVGKDVQKNGTRKKTKSLKTVDRTSIKSKRLAEGVASDVEDHTLTRQQEEDDGAMDSDFEFQVGDTSTGLVDGFDGWDMKESWRGSSPQGNKKGVDIDELISRRRKKGKEPGNGDGSANDTPGIPENGLNGEEVDLSVDKEGIEDASQERSVDRDDDEELLASDGFGMGAVSDDEQSDSEAAESVSERASDEGRLSDDASDASPTAHPDDEASSVSSTDAMNDQAQKLRHKAFFAPEDEKNNFTIKDLSSFQNMSLSRPILRGLASVGFSEPTPIQAKTIPVALLGKDVVGGAVTGSGKTAAFIVPVLERLLYRPKKVPTSRVAILMPTRELAVQCFNVAKKLASFTDISFCQLVGGFSLREQENVLRTRPDVIIATPGRFIDHMRNSPTFATDTLEILILDEADRMLETGFADELNEILTTIPKSRQTMLFSATMTDSVDKLIRVGLNRPVRLLVDARKQTVGTLVQEFIRLRPRKEERRLSYLMHLCEKVYTERAIIFFRQKREAHRVRVIFGLCGFKAAELHGSMTQEQRIASIESFRSSKVSHLLATDVASRGLDIKGVETVINYEAPQSHEIYLHRVGRTARAGKSGRACTIAAEPDRKIVKMAVKAGREQGAKIVSRVVESSIVDGWAKRLESVENEVEEILKQEKEEKQFGQAEMQVKRAENIMDYEKEIMGRPKRTWFTSEKEKSVAKNLGKAELNGADSVKGNKDKKRLTRKDKKKLDDSRERLENRVWKKGKAERAGQGVLDKGGKKAKSGKNVKRGPKRSGKK